MVRVRGHAKVRFLSKKNSSNRVKTNWLCFQYESFASSSNDYVLVVETKSQAEMTDSKVQAKVDAALKCYVRKYEK